MKAVQEHPLFVRLTHWVTAVTVIVMTLSGLRILKAFPAFGPKVPQKDFFDPPGLITLGGWLGGALRWHFTFMWLFMGAGLWYVVAQLVSGRYRRVLFTRRDLGGVWPMARHYFLFGPKPAMTEQYNPLQKLAYTTTILMGALSMCTGLVLYKPAQLSGLAWIFGGFHLTRVWHFIAMCGFVAFIPGHLLMVALHGWNNFMSMLTGWKADPEYLAGEASPPAPDNRPSRYGDGPPESDPRPARG